MKVLVVSDRIGRLGPAEASDLLGAAFAARGAHVAVAPPGVAGEDFAAAVARFAPHARLSHPDTLRQLRAAAARLPDYLDVTDLAGPELADLVMWPVVELTGVTLVVPPGEAEVRLTGLGGALAARGRDEGWDLAATVETNQRAEAWLAALGIPDQPGAGACRGLGAWALAGGAKVVSSLEACSIGYDLARVADQADLLVTATHELDFHRRGGEVVRWLAQLAEDSLTPLVVVTGRNYVSQRELRLGGIEEAHALVGPGASEFTIEQAQLRELADRVATTWVW